jgi:hypothetical protein
METGDSNSDSAVRQEQRREEKGTQDAKPKEKVEGGCGWKVLFEDFTRDVILSRSDFRPAVSGFFFLLPVACNRSKSIHKRPANAMHT